MITNNIVHCFWTWEGLRRSVNFIITFFQSSLLWNTWSLLIVLWLSIMMTYFMEKLITSTTKFPNQTFIFFKNIWVNKLLFFWIPFCFLWCSCERCWFLLHFQLLNDWIDHRVVVLCKDSFDGQIFHWKADDKVNLNCNIINACFLFWWKTNAFLKIWLSKCVEFSTKVEWKCPSLFSKISE